MVSLKFRRRLQHYREKVNIYRPHVPGLLLDRMERDHLPNNTTICLKDQRDIGIEEEGGWGPRQGASIRAAICAMLVAVCNILNNRLTQTTATVVPPALLKAGLPAGRSKTSSRPWRASGRQHRSARIRGLRASRKRLHGRNSGIPDCQCGGVQDGLSEHDCVLGSGYNFDFLRAE